jgi:hypothetical protein
MVGAGISGVEPSDYTAKVFVEICSQSRYSSIQLKVIQISSFLKLLQFVSVLSIINLNHLQDFA